MIAIDFGGRLIREDRTDRRKTERTWIEPDESVMPYIGMALEMFWEMQKEGIVDEEAISLAFLANCKTLPDTPRKMQRAVSKYSLTFYETALSIDGDDEVSTFHKISLTCEIAVAFNSRGRCVRAIIGQSWGPLPAFAMAMIGVFMEMDQLRDETVTWGEWQPSPGVEVGVA